VSVAVLIPWGGDCTYRHRALEWVTARYEELGLPVVLGESPERWNKGLAVANGLERCSADVIVLADADVWCDGITNAIRAVEAGAPWSIPHLLVNRLSEQGTDALLAGEPWEGLPLDQRPYRGVQGGGIVVLPREVLASVQIDPRFTHWGQEDQSHALALYTLTGPAWRGDADLIHLWHPPQPRLSRRRGSVEGWQHFHRYRKARNDPVAMRRLLEEINAD